MYIYVYLDIHMYLYISEMHDKQYHKYERELYYCVLILYMKWYKQFEDTPAISQRSIV